jgi:hypothetical protein
VTGARAAKHLTFIIGVGLGNAVLSIGLRHLGVVYAVMVFAAMLGVGINGYLSGMDDA